MCEYYEINAKQYAKETFSADMSEQYKRFLPLLRERARILAVGSGSGRDACYFQKKGYQVTALEPSKNLCREIQKAFSGKIVCSDIQSYQPDQRFDGIWACASFLHLRLEEVLCFFENIDLYLNDNGVVYLSGKNGIYTGESEDGRYFLEFTEELVENILVVNERMKLKELWYTEDVRGRQGFRWMNIVVKMV